MNELIKRFTTGFVYAGTILGAVYFGDIVFDMVFMVLCILGIMELRSLVKLSVLETVSVVVILLLCYVSVTYYKADIILWLSPLYIIYFMLIYGLFTGESSLLVSKRILVLPYALWVIFLIVLERQLPSTRAVIHVFILVWTYDSAAYLVGKNLGKRKLFPSVSPKKTVEGCIGGGIFTLLSAIFFYYFNNEENISSTIGIGFWVIAAIVVVVFGTVGDLMESQIKRLAKVKDSGRLLPGHGGVLDRIDSLIFIAPFLYLTYILIRHVS